MRLDNNCKLRLVAGEYIILLPSQEGDSLTRVISFNESARYLWEALKDREFTEDDAVKALTEEYDVDASTASADVDKWLETLKAYKLLA